MRVNRWRLFGAVLPLVWCGLAVIPAHAEETPGYSGVVDPQEIEKSIHGEEEGTAESPGLTGNWGGYRNRLEEQGLTVELIYTGEFVRNFTPGLVNGRKQTIYHDNLDLALTFDSEKAGLWQGGTLFIYGIRNHGGDPTGNVIGDLQAVSNIEAPDQFILYEAWFEQQLFNGRASLLLGLHDMNSEFYVSDYASLFLNSSFGIGPEITANVAASIFPKPGLGVRLRINPVDHLYAQAALYDGDPATRRLAAHEGKMGIGEIGYLFDGGAIKAGYWQHTAQVNYAGRNFSRNYGYYALADARLYRFGEGEARSVNTFVQLGQAAKSRNAVNSYVGAGLHLHGLLPGRGEDDLGFAMARANTDTGSETTYELTYRLVATSWLAIQPSFQWVDNTGGVTAAPTSRVGLLRFEVTL